MRGEALGDEVLRGMVGGGVVVDGPDVEDDGGVFGEEEFVDPRVCFRRR